MIKLILVVTLWLIGVTFAQELPEKLSSIMRDFEAQEIFVVAKPDVSELHIMSAEGADAYVQEQNGLYSWRLLREYWYDYDTDTTGATTGLYLDYRPNSDIQRLFPAHFALWHSKPYDTIADYLAAFEAASKIAAGSSYLELSNEPDTLYQSIPGWDYSYQYRSGTTNYILKSHTLLLNSVIFNVFFLTTKTDYDDILSKLWYSLILSDVEFAGATAIAERETFDAVRSFLLLPNYPNPFNAATIIPYRVTKRSMVSLNIFDVQGKLVEQVFNRMHEAGDYQIRWEGKKSSGIYFYQISDGVSKASGRMILVR